MWSAGYRKCWGSASRLLLSGRAVRDLGRSESKNAAFDPRLRSPEAKEASEDVFQKRALDLT